MKIFNPLQTSFSHRTVEKDRKFYWVASVKLHIRISNNKAQFEHECISDLMDTMGSIPTPDMGMPKPTGEYLVSGAFYSEHGKPVSGGQVQVKFNNKKKTLNIFGDRNWTAMIPSSPIPINTVPLLYEYAFGGEGNELNPTGKGFNSSELPNIEESTTVISSNKTKYNPAGFAPIDSTWPQRSKYQGSYDESYLEKYYPGYPEDMDWRLFMTAPEDQWSESFFKGDEEFRLKNLHPAKSLIHGQLPGFTPRCFINDTAEEHKENQFKELDLNLDTVWFFPDKDIVQLVWRSVIPVQQDDAEQISHALIAYEQQDDIKRSKSHYFEAMNRRIQNKNPMEDSLNTQDLIPLGEKSAMQKLTESALEGADKSEMAKNMEAKSTAISEVIQEHVDNSISDIKAQVKSSSLGDVEKNKLFSQLREVKSSGQDDDLTKLMDEIESLLPGASSGDLKDFQFSEFSFEKLNLVMTEIRQFTEAKQEGSLLLIKPEIERLKKILNEAQLDNSLTKDEADKIHQQLLSLENISSNSSAPISGLPRMDINAIQQQLLGVSDQLQAAQKELHLLASNPLLATPQAINKASDDIKLIKQQEMEKINTQLEQAKKQFFDGYLMGAHFAPDGLSPHLDDELQRSKLLQLVNANKDVSHMDWACLDLKGLNFDGVDFSGCLLEQVDFTGASLRGAIFEGAILARANFTNANCERATFNFANIGASICKGTNFESASFNMTKLSQCEFDECSFIKSKIIDPETLELSIKHCNFDYAVIENWTFLEQSLNFVKFTNTQMTRCSFIDCELFDSHFDFSQMTSTTWAGTNLVRISFVGADMTSNCFVAGEDKDCTLQALDFSSTILSKVNFQNLCFINSIFKEAILDNANFMGCKLEGSEFEGCSALKTQFQKANLNNCNFQSSNLMDAILSKAIVTNVDLKNANLYGVDFIRATVKGTDFSGANLDATILKDWRPA